MILDLDAIEKRAKAGRPWPVGVEAVLTRSEFLERAHLDVVALVEECRALRARVAELEKP